MTLPPQSSSAIVRHGNGTLRICRRGHKNSILLVALSRPSVKNAFSEDVYEGLIQVLQETTVDPSLSAIVLTGTGSYFSSGVDLKETNFIPDDGAPRDTLNSPTGRFMMQVLGFPKLLAAAVNGPVVGIGMTTLSHCDLCYCTESATFWSPFTRIALVPEFCSSAVFSDRMGLVKANELLLLGKKVDAETAVRWNLCSRVVPNCNASGDPFHANSLASKMCNEIDDRLLSLPRGAATVEVFVSLIRGPKRAHLQKVCRDELQRLDERFNDGECLEAAMHLSFGNSKL